MKTTVEKLPQSEVSLKIELDAGELKDDFSVAYKRVANKYKIPGFRKGKIPANIIDARLGKGVVLDEMIKTAVPKFYYKAVIDEGIKPVRQPQFEIVDIKDDGTLSFNAKVMVKPDVKLGKYEGIKVKLPKLDATAAEVKDRLNLLKERFSELKPVDRGVCEGDYVLVDYDVYHEKNKVDEFSISDHMMEIDDAKLNPEIKKKITGAKAGDDVETSIKLPDDYQDSKLAGKMVSIKIKVKEIKEKTLPEENDEFAQMASEFDTLKELKQSIKEKILEQKKQMREVQLRQKVLDELIKSSKIEIPDKMIEEEKQHLKKDFISSVEARKMSLEDYLKITGSDEKKFEESIEEEAVKLIKNEMILDAVAEDAKVDVTIEELQEEVKNYALQSNQPVEKLYKQLEENGKILNIKYDVKLRKALNLIAEKAAVADEEVKPAAKQNKNKSK